MTSELIEETTKPINNMLQIADVCAAVICVIALLLFCVILYIKRIIINEVSYYFVVLCVLWGISIFFAPVWSVLSLVTILYYKEFSIKKLRKLIKNSNDAVLKYLIDVSEKSVPNAILKVYNILMGLGILNIVLYFFCGEISEEAIRLHFYPVALSGCPFISITSLGLVLVTIVSIIFCSFSKFIFLTDSKMQIRREEMDEYYHVENAYDDDEEGV